VCTGVLILIDRLKTFQTYDNDRHACRLWEPFINIMRVVELDVRSSKLAHQISS